MKVDDDTIINLATFHKELPQARATVVAVNYGTYFPNVVPDAVAADSQQAQFLAVTPSVNPANFLGGAVEDEKTAMNALIRDADFGGEAATCLTRKIHNIDCG